MFRYTCEGLLKFQENEIELGTINATTKVKRAGGRGGGRRGGDN